MLKREWGAESNGKLPHLFILSKTATYVPDFAMEDLPLDRIAALVPEFEVDDFPLRRTLMSTAVEQVVVCALVMQRARFQSPVGTSFLGEVFRVFLLL